MVVTKSYSKSDVRIPVSEVCAYLGIKGDPEESVTLKIKSCISELAEKIRPMVCYADFPVSVESDSVFLGFASVKSADLARRLNGCQKIILMAVTVGLDADRLVSKYSLTEPSRALILQAVGTVAVESLADLVCAELSNDQKLRERFSCGYGDLDLSLQRDIFSALDCQKRIGLTLNSSLLMSPTKSVTAIIGIEK